MANCTVSGTFTNPQGTAISGATVRFNLQKPVLDLSGNLLMPKEITTTTAADGTWSLSIIQGVAGNLTLAVNTTSNSPSVNYNFSLLIPSTTTATFASCWVDSSTFAGGTATTPLTFASIAGQLATSQLPALPSADVWVGDGTGTAAAVAVSGDVSLANTGAVTVNAVGGSTSALLHSAELAANAATNLNTVSTIVKRDASGNFSAGAVSVGSLAATGNVSAGGTLSATGTVTGSNLSGTNTGDLVLGSFGATPSAQGASLSGQTIQLQPADGSNPGSLSTGSQTIAGVKTFSSAPNLSSLTASQALVLDGSKNIASLAYATAATASALAQRDANGNILAVNCVSGATNVVSAGTTTTLTAASTRLQQLTGSSNQTFKLPDATTLAVGSTWDFNNNSTGVLSVVDNGSNAIISVPSGGQVRVTAIAVSTANGAWDSHFSLPSNASFGTSGLSITGTLTASGTITFSSFNAVGVLLNNASGVLSSLAPGTSGNVVTSNGTTWVSSAASAGPAAIAAVGYINSYYAFR